MNFIITNVKEAGTVLSRRFGGLSAGALALVVVLAGCSSSGSSKAGAGSSANASSGAGGSASSAAGSKVVDVVAGENFWGDIISQIGGSHVEVTSIISDPNTDPHEYESDAKDAAAISKASFVLENGIGYDDFMDKLLSASPNSGREVLSVQKILDVTGDDPNPHIWYDTAKLPQVASAVSDELSKLDPADASTFAANAQTFDTSLQPITHVINQIKAKYAGTKIAYTERVPGYLILAAGLVLGVPASFTQAVEDGTDPSPADTAAFDNAIKDKTVNVLLYNGQVTDSQTTQIKQLATSSGVPIVGVTETLPPTDKDFQAWQLRQAQEILTALGS
jgi:zinc/manganese transport system substrate-binding protein